MAVDRIYEFSTGITYEIRNGQWFSTGFTVGEYMNQTIENIPQCVQRAIANNLFEVSKNSQSQEPTIVGRVVRGNKAKNDLDWSVVAIATLGADDYQRHTGFYRYFLCNGADSLWKIVDWLEDYRKKFTYWPIYNPADTKKIGQETLHDCGRQKPELSSQWHDFLNQRPTPLIFNSEASYDLTTLNAIAEYKAQTKSQPTSWAWNVEAIENPRNFLVIQAANDNAYRLLEKILDPRISMAEIQRSIKGLIGGGNIKREWIQTLVQAKKQNQLTSQQWEKIFEDLGGKSGSVSANIVRLLTLRAIILPETLSDYLQYLEIKKQNQTPNQQQQTSLKFQSQIRPYRNLLDDLLSEGAISVAELNGARKRMDFLPAVAWLFDGTQPGLWLKYKVTFISKVQKIFKDLSSSIKKYGSLEKLFKEWGTELYISSHPYSPRGGTRSTIYTSSQEQESISWIEWLEENIVEVIVQGLFLVIFFISVAFQEPSHAHVLIYAIASGMIRVFLNKKQLDNTLSILGVLFAIIITFLALVVNYLGTNKVEPDQIGVLPQNQNQNQNQNYSSDTIPDYKKEEAIARFDYTRRAIQNIVADLAQELPSLEEESPQNQQARKRIVITAFRETLGSNNQFDLQYGAVIEGEVGSDRRKERYRDIWIEAIYLYQQSIPALNGRGFGYIEIERQTHRALREDIRKNPLFAFIPRTRVALNQIVNELKSPTGISPTETEIIIKIKDALGFEGDYTKAMEQGNRQEINKLIQAIKKYQQKNSLSSSGIIEPGGKTYNKLKKDLRKN